jgi:hypothetical protein
MKNAVFWDVAPRGFIINRRFGRTCPSDTFIRPRFSSTLKMEATRSSETSTSIYSEPTRLHIPQDGIFKKLFSHEEPTFVSNF